MNESVNFDPNEDRILIEPYDHGNKIGSIIIPDTVKEKPCKGSVRAIGEEVQKFKVGDKVIYGKYAGTLITINKKDYLIVRKSDIFGTVGEF